MKHVVVWLFTVLYFFVLSASLTYLFIPGILRVSGAGDISAGILLIVGAAIVWYAATAFFLTVLPPRVFTGLRGIAFSENIRCLPKLIGVLAIFGVAFAVLSRLIILIIWNAVFHGDISLAAGTVNICMIVLALASLPFYTRAFAGYAGGDRRFGTLLSGSIRIGGLLYLKYLGMGVAAFVLAYFVRYLTPRDTAPSGIGALVLTALVLGAALLLAWKAYAVEKRCRASQDAREDDTEEMTERKAAG